MSEGELLARLRQAEDRIKQLEYRISILESQQGQSQLAVSLLRSASAN